MEPVLTREETTAALTERVAELVLTYHHMTDGEHQCNGVGCARVASLTRLAYAAALAGLTAAEERIQLLVK